MGAWTPAPRPAARIETVGNQLLSRIIKPVVLNSASTRSISLERQKIVSSWREEMDLSLISIWALTLARWVHHVFRHTAAPAYLLLHSQSADWLRHVRILNGRSLRYADGVNAGETCTRGESGNVVRWAGRWLEAVGERVPLENAARDAGMTRELTNCLHALLTHGRWQGERVLVI